MCAIATSSSFRDEDASNNQGTNRLVVRRTNTGGCNCNDAAGNRHERADSFRRRARRRRNECSFFFFFSGPMGQCMVELRPRRSSVKARQEDDQRDKRRRLEKERKKNGIDNACRWTNQPIGTLLRPLQPTPLSPTEIIISPPFLVLDPLLPIKIPSSTLTSIRFHTDGANFYTDETKSD